MSELFKSSLLFSDHRLCHADILPPSQVRARMEVAILSFLKNLTSPNPAISDLRLIDRRSTNRNVRRSLLSDDSCIYLSSAFSTRSLMKENAAKAFVRVWKVMEICYGILVQEKRVTQRELYYKLLSSSPGYFSSQKQANKTIQDVVALLRCSRYSLGIMASSRGLITGRLLMQEPNREAVDCTTCGSSGHAITGDLSLLENMFIETDARYIIVIEKHAIFQRLAEDRIFNQIPSILITAKGFPDIATQVLLHRLSKKFPSLPIIALVDWNPAGLAILCTFKYGSIGMGLEAYRYGDTTAASNFANYTNFWSQNLNLTKCSTQISACNVKWIGLRGNDLQMIPEESLVPLKSRDLQTAKSLTSSDILPDNFKEELSLMIQSGKRADIETLYCHGYDYLGKYLAKKIVQADYI